MVVVHRRASCSICDRQGRIRGRYVAFQMAEVAIPRQIFQEILRLIAELRSQPPPASAWDVRWSSGQGNRREESVQMRRKMARSAPPPPFGPPGVAAVVRAASLACQNAVPKLDVRLTDPCARSRTCGPHAARPPQVGTANRSVLKQLPRTPVLLGGV